MSLISTTFAAELSDKEMRDAYLSAQTRTHLSYQIRTIRCQRGWSQEEFAEKLHTSQSAVSRMEDREYGKQNLQTLVEVANAFDCGLVVQFVPYDDFIRKTDNLSREALEVPEFNETTLLPLSEDQFSFLGIGHVLPPLSQQAIQFNADHTLNYSTSVAQSGLTLLYGLASVNAPISDQPLQANRMVSAPSDDKMPIGLFGLDQRSSQFPSIS
jgi:transcriptional regulator with XRE-family HTH domain